MVARQTLTLFVRVRILLRLPTKKQLFFGKAAFFMSFLGFQISRFLMSVKWFYGSRQDSACPLLTNCIRIIILIPSHKKRGTALLSLRCPPLERIAKILYHLYRSKRCKTVLNTGISLHFYYFAMFSQKRIRIVATSARVALPAGLSVVLVTPVIRPSAFAHCIAAIA